MSQAPSRFGGRCACGAVVYECSAPPLGMTRCYCRDCQRAGGSGHSPTVIVNRASFRVTRGEPKVFESPAESGNTARRAFCAACGSPLFASTSGRPDFVGIRAGSLDDPSWFAPRTAFWAESAQPWDAVDPALTQVGRI